MARSRRGSRTAPTESAETTAQEEIPAPTIEPTRKERVTKMATVLSMEEISGLLANTRGRGEYAQYLQEFITSGEPGWKVDLESGILAGKSIDKAYVGLNNAKTAENVVKDADSNVISRSPKVPGADKVKVVKSPDKENPALFLINRSLVEGASGEETDTTDE